MTTAQLWLETTSYHVRTYSWRHSKMHWRAPVGILRNMEFYSELPNQVIPHGPGLYSPTLHAGTRKFILENTVISLNKDFDYNC